MRLSKRGSLLTVPAFLYYTLFLIAPMIGLLVLSISSAERGKIILGVRLENYITIFSAPLYQEVLVRTVFVGLLASIIVVPIVFGLAYLLRFVLTRRAQLITQAVLITLFAGYLVRIYAWRTILGREGVLNSFLLFTGVTKEPVRAFIYSPWSVAIALCGLVLPLALLPMSSAFENVERAHLEVARDLGSKGVALLRTVLLPMVMPGVTTAFLFSFLLSAGDFVTPTLIGGSNGVMIGNVIADQFRGIGSNWPLGAALVWVTVAVVGVVYLAIVRLLRWWSSL